ncbi:MAG: GPP34 family phosphoprotein [Mycobacteriaceae bacterium]
MNSPLLLAEELFLLAHDEGSGKPGDTMALANGLAGALLLDLAAQELLTAEGKTLTAVGTEPSDPLLAEAHAAIRADAKPRSAGYWVGHLPSTLKPLNERVGRCLAERGVLSEQHKKVWGLFPTTTWPEVDPEPERALRAGLTAVLVDGAQPDHRTALLIPLVKALGMVRGVVGKQHKKQAEARAKEIVEAGAVETAVSAAVSQSVQAVQMAVLTAVIVPTVVTSS